MRMNELSADTRWEKSSALGHCRVLEIAARFETDIVCGSHEGRPPRWGDEGAAFLGPEVSSVSLGASNVPSPQRLLLPHPGKAPLALSPEASSGFMGLRY